MSGYVYSSGGESPQPPSLPPNKHYFLCYPQSIIPSDESRRHIMTFNKRAQRTAPYDHHRSLIVKKHYAAVGVIRFQYNRKEYWMFHRRSIHEMRYLD